MKILLNAKDTNTRAGILWNIVVSRKGHTNAADVAREFEGEKK